MTDPTERFGGRGAVFARARPSYPDEVFAILASVHGLGKETVVADVGSGTGIFTKLLLGTACARVFAVEPNADMRKEAERELGANPRFVSVHGRAEATTLEDASIDSVTAAQAFHWFDVDRFHLELRRVLRPNGRAALVWNDRDLEGTPFLRDYEAVLVEHCPGYRALQGKSDTPAKFDAIFGRGGWSRHETANEQRLDERGLVERVMSASYAPRASTPAYAALVRALHAIFDQHAERGEVQIVYTAVVIGGVVGAIPRTERATR